MTDHTRTARARTRTLERRNARTLKRTADTGTVRVTRAAHVKASA